MHFNDILKHAVLCVEKRTKHLIAFLCIHTRDIFVDIIILWQNNESYNYWTFSKSINFHLWGNFWGPNVENWPNYFLNDRETLKLDFFLKSLITLFGKSILNGRSKVENSPNL